MIRSAIVCALFSLSVQKAEAQLNPMPLNISASMSDGYPDGYSDDDGNIWIDLDVSLSNCNAVGGTYTTVAYLSDKNGNTYTVVVFEGKAYAAGQLWVDTPNLMLDEFDPRLGHGNYSLTVEYLWWDNTGRYLGRIDLGQFFLQL